MQLILQRTKNWSVKLAPMRIVGEIGETFLLAKFACIYSSCKEIL